ncbi:hypothetical protein PENTCL1PPCAC_6512, partial [Pristionchus entomophagus]
IQSSIMKVIVILAALVGASLATDCFKCICNKESGCQPIGCVMDVGSLSCGYYQIKSPYYQDCGQPGKQAGDSLDTAWKRCADDYNCSTLVSRAYVARYKSGCPNRGSCEQTARLHNGGASLATDCLKCICNKESGCKPIGCVMDVGSLSCGYYQIKSPYYQDCGQPGKKAGDTLDTAWKRCADDYNCSTGCVQAYVNRYKSKCPNKGSCEQMSRLHNGGPNGCNVSGTQGYWNSIK